MRKSALSKFLKYPILPNLNKLIDEISAKEGESIARAFGKRNMSIEQLSNHPHLLKAYAKWEKIRLRSNHPLCQEKSESTDSVILDENKELVTPENATACNINKDEEIGEFFSKVKHELKQKLKDKIKNANTIEDFLKIAESACRDLDDKTWATEIYHNAIEKATSSSNFQEIGASIIENLNDDEWGLEIHQEANRIYYREQEIDKYIQEITDKGFWQYENVINRLLEQSGDKQLANEVHFKSVKAFLNTLDDKQALPTGISYLNMYLASDYCNIENVDAMSFFAGIYSRYLADIWCFDGGFTLVYGVFSKIPFDQDELKNIYQNAIDIAETVEREFDIHFSVAYYYISFGLAHPVILNDPQAAAVMLHKALCNVNDISDFEAPFIILGIDVSTYKKIIHQNYALNFDMDVEREFLGMLRDYIESETFPAYEHYEDLPDMEDLAEWTADWAKEYDVLWKDEIGNLLNDCI